MRLGLGISLTSPRYAGPSTPQLNAITLSTPTIPENTAAGTTVGALQGRTTGSTLSIVDTAGTRFALSGTNIQTGATATNYEAATSHNITIRETLAGYPNSPRDSVISIAVTNVFEAASLSVLTLSATSFTHGTSTSGTINGATTGSTITAGTLPDGFTINGPGRTWAYDGDADATSGSITLTETLADSANSPRQSVIALTFAAASASALNTPLLNFADNKGAGDFPLAISVYVDHTASEGTHSLRLQTAATQGGTPIINTLIALNVAGGVTAAIATALAGTTSGTRWARVRIEGGADDPSPWSIDLLHGDTSTPSFTNGATPTIYEGIAFSVPLTTNVSVREINIFSGDQMDKFTISGSNLVNYFSSGLTIAGLENGASQEVVLKAVGYNMEPGYLTMTASVQAIVPSMSPAFANIFSATAGNAYTVSGTVVLPAGITVNATSFTAGIKKQTGGTGSFVTQTGTFSVQNGDVLKWDTTGPAANSVNGFTVTIHGVVFNAVVAGTYTLPKQSDLDFWFEARDTSKLFQTITATTAVAADGDPVGSVVDKSAAAFNNMAATANSNVRPTYRTGTAPYVEFDGSNDAWRSPTALGLHASGSFTILLAVRASNNAGDKGIVAEGRQSSGNTVFAPIRFRNGTALAAGAYMRNDANGTVVNNNSDLKTGVFDGSDAILFVTWDGTNLLAYDDLGTATTLSYTPSGTFTLDRFAIGADVSGSGFYGYAPMRLYGAMVWKGEVLNSSDRAQAISYAAIELQGRAV